MREKLPTRRPNQTIDVEFEGHCYAVTLGFGEQGEVKEVFSTGKVGSSMAATLADGCIFISLLLQYGVLPKDISRPLSRLDCGTSPASILGVLADLIAAEVEVG